MVISIRATAHTKTQLSSFEVVFGQKMNVGDPNFRGEPPPMLTRGVITSIG